MPPPKIPLKSLQTSATASVRMGKTLGTKKAQPGHRGDHTYADKIRFTYDLIVADERK